MGTAAAKIQLAERLLSKHGVVMQVKTFTKVENSAQPWKPLPNTSKTEDVSGVEDSYAVNLIDGEKIQVNDKRIYLSPLKTDGNALTEPTTTSVVINEGLTWEIIKVNKIKYQGKVILYDLQVRT